MTVVQIRRGVIPEAEFQVVLVQLIKLGATDPRRADGLGRETRLIFQGSNAVVQGQWLCSRIDQVGEVLELDHI